MWLAATPQISPISTATASEPSTSFSVIDPQELYPTVQQQRLLSLIKYRATILCLTVVSSIIQGAKGSESSTLMRS